MQSIQTPMFPVAGQLGPYFPHTFVYVCLVHDFLHFPVTTLTDSVVAPCHLQAMAQATDQQLSPPRA